MEHTKPNTTDTTSLTPSALIELARLLARQAAREVVGRQAEQGCSTKTPDLTEKQP